MNRVVGASLNPVTCRAVELGFSQMFPGWNFTVTAEPVVVAVPDQPRSDDETRAGSLLRAQAARQAVPQADYWVGVEGGVAEDPPALRAFAWITVLSDGQCGQARTGVFALPERVAALVRGGMELGPADDLVFGQENSKQAAGAVGLLTGGALDRAGFYAQAVLLALIPFRNPELYPR